MINILEYLSKFFILYIRLLLSYITFNNNSSITITIIINYKHFLRTYCYFITLICHALKRYWLNVHVIWLL